MTALVPATQADTRSVADRLGFGSGWLLANLPMSMQEDHLLARFVGLFEEMASTTRFAVEGTEHTADVTVTPAEVVRYLGAWVTAPALHEQLPADVQRRIVRAAGSSLAWRGTAHALATLLEAVTGGWVDIDDAGCVSRDGEAPKERLPVVVRLERTGHLREDELVALIRAEVPAHVPTVVLIDGEVVWPVPAGATTNRTVR
jgi:phage tail-like protein